MFCYKGRILHIDLSKAKIWKEELNKDLVSMYVGSRGINAKLLWDYLKEPGIDPFDPRNPLLISPGTFTGTVAPSSGRTTVTCKGAITGLYLKTSIGSAWGAEFKHAGYDVLAIHGASLKPVYISIVDDEVGLLDASYLWGKDVLETSEIIKKDSNDKEVKVLAIGPAGENLVRFAGIVNSEVYNTAGRGGSGAVMGSKKLKAIAVRGTRKLKLFDEANFVKLSARIRHELANDSGAKALYDYGTPNSMEWMNYSFSLPSRNFSKGHVDNIEPLTGQNLIERQYLVKRMGCDSCSIMCHRRVKIQNGKYSGVETSGPEYETFAALGSQLMVLDTDYVIKANELCNIYGMDTISTGAVIAWSMEVFERGLINKEDTEGLNLMFGNGEAELEIIRRIAFRKGRFGNLLAEGTKRASEKIGKDSIKYAAVNSKGLEQSSVNTRVAKAYALAFAVNPRGPDHLMTETLAEFGATPEAVAVVEKVTGDKRYAIPYITDFKPEIVRWHEDVYALTDSLGFCAFATTAAYAVNPSNMAEFYYLATGIRLGGDELMLIGRRTVTIEKCFNVREGIDRRYDDLPWKMMNDPEPEGPRKGYLTSKEELDGMLDRYYELHGWDKKTSWPYKETLEKLKLIKEEKDLEKLGRVPRRNV